MDALRFHALLIGTLCGYALGRWAGLCGPAGECLTWGFRCVERRPVSG